MILSPSSPFWCHPVVQIWMRSGIPKSLRTLISRLRKLFILSWYALSHIGVGFTDSTVPFFKNVQQMRCVSHKKEYITMMSDIPNCSITTGHLFTPTTKKPGVG